MDRRLFLYASGSLAAAAGIGLFFGHGLRRLFGERMTKFPTTDLHYHLDAMSPRAIKAVSERHDLPWTGKEIEEIKMLAQVQPGVSWNEWYAAHKKARAAVFVKPEIFEDVAREAVRDAELEGLDARVMRFSLSMPEYCFMAMEGRKPDLKNEADKRLFYSLLDQTIGYLSRGTAFSMRTKTPLVFSLSQQDKYQPLLDGIVRIALDHKSNLAGIDLTNEQVHKLATDYRTAVEALRAGGIEALTIHVGEKNRPEKESKFYTAEERIKAALEMRPDTLGHAIYAAESREAVEAMAKSRVVVELCPTSNLYLNQEFVDDVMEGNPAGKNYPLLAFQQAGIPCTLNSDVPGSIENGSLAGEFALVQKIFGLDANDLRRLDDTARETAQKMYRV